MKRKVFTIVLSCYFIFASSISAKALSVNLDSMDYTQREVYINEFKKSAEERLENISSEKDKNEKILNETKKEVIKIKKETQSKKNISSNNAVFVDNNNLQVWETLLNSNSFSDMMNNFNIMKNKKLSKDKSLNIMGKQEDLLIEKYKTADDKIKSLETEDKKLKIEISEINDIADDLKKKMERKEGEITFDPSNLLRPSNMSVKDMYKVLEGTALYELAPVYIEAENIYGVNALFIVGITAEESGWGTSKRAVEDNNLTGLGVYTDSSTGINAQTKRDNVLMTTKLLKDSYLTVGGSYYNGVSIRGVNTRYCIGTNGTTDYNWSEKITNIATNLLNKVEK